MYFRICRCGARLAYHMFVSASLRRLQLIRATLFLDTLSVFAANRKLLFLTASESARKEVSEVSSSTELFN